LVFYGTEIADAPEPAFSVCLQSFSGQKQMIFHAKAKTMPKKSNLDQYNSKYSKESHTAPSGCQFNPKGEISC